MKRRKRATPSPLPSPSFPSASLSALLPHLSLTVPLTVLAVVPFVPSLKGEFIFDDRRTVVENGIVTGKRPLRELFSSDYWGDPIASPTSHKSYRPVTTLTFWLNYLAGGLDPTGYHVVNVVIHLMNTLLVYRLVRRLQRILSEDGGTRNEKRTGFGSLIAAAAFAAHPVHVEAVANVSGRAELLMSFFALLAVLAYSSRRLGTVPRLATVASLTLLSTLSKEQGVMTPILCIVLDLLRSSSFSYSIISRVAVKLSTSAIIAVSRSWMNGWTSPQFTRHENPAAFLEGTLFKLVNYAHYWLYSLCLLLFPSQLCFDYSMATFPPIVSLSDYRIISPLALAAIGITVAAVILRSSEKRYLLFSVFVTLVYYFPASHLPITVGFTVAERVLYLPSLGVCMAAGAMINHLSSTIPASRKLAIALIGVALAASFHRSEDWQSSLRLYSRDAQVCPTNAKIHYNLAKVLADSGRTHEAEMRYREALRLHPTYEAALNNLGNILEATGRVDEAEGVLEEAVRIAPRFAAAWMNLGIAKMHLAKYNDSERSFRISLGLRPNSGEALFNVGVLRLKQGREDEAERAWVNATRLDPGHSRAWSNLFVLLDEQDRCDEVVAFSSLALAECPGQFSLHLSTGMCLAKAGRLPEAERELIRAIELQPSNAVGHANLGVLYQRWHRYDRALAAYKTALALAPGTESVRENERETRRRLNMTDV